MAKYRITWQGGAQEEVMHDGNLQSLIDSKWGSTPVPEGCDIEDISDHPEAPPVTTKSAEEQNGGSVGAQHDFVLQSNETESTQQGESDEQASKE